MSVNIETFEKNKLFVFVLEFIYETKQKYSEGNRNK